jgi:hypothetical protein
MGTKKPKAGEATVRDALAYIPSKIRANHLRNYSREQFTTPPELKRYLGDVCSFTLAEIEERLASLKKHKQISPVNIYLTGTGDAFLARGYLRHAAFLLAEARGERDQIPGSGGKILCTLVTEPKSEADWLALAEANYAENTDIKSLTAVDKARYVSRLLMPVSEGGFGRTQEQALQAIGLTDKRQLDRYLRLLKLPPDVRADVHFGRVTMSKALSGSTDKGEAGSPGERAGIKHTSTRSAHEHIVDRPAPTRGLNAEEMRLYTALCSGVLVMDEDEMPENLRAWYRWSAPTPEEIKALKPKREPKPTTKKSPPKPDAHVEASA